MRSPRDREGAAQPFLAPAAEAVDASARLFSSTASARALSIPPSPATPVAPIAPEASAPIATVRQLSASAPDLAADTPGNCRCSGARVAHGGLVQRVAPGRSFNADYQELVEAISDDTILNEYDKIEVRGG